MIKTIQEGIAIERHIAISGTRNGCSAEVFAQAANSINRAAHIYTGCARGVDAQARAWGKQHLPPTQTYIFDVDDPEHTGSFAWRLAQRSMAMVDAAFAQGGVLVAFPGRPLPKGLRPAKTWQSGYRSGTWSTASYAVGHGMATYVYLADEHKASLLEFADYADPFNWLPHQLDSNWFKCLPF